MGVLPGVREPVVEQATFETVQSTTMRNSGRSMTLQSRPQRHYLLKGIVRCAYCLMPMWAQTYKGGSRYYREHRSSRSIAECPAFSGSISCHVADEQVGRLVGAIELGPGWLEEVLGRISLKDEADR